MYNVTAVEEGADEQRDPETRALVTTLRDRVEGVTLWGDVTLNIEELTQYDGQGCCSVLHVYYDMRTRYGERLRGWAEDRGWTWTVDSEWRLEMQR